jgi:hypothetical protein
MENIRAMVVKADSEVLTVTDHFEHSLESLQKAVGGYIEAVSVTHDIVMWVNEEGKLNNLTPNFNLNGIGDLILDVVVGDVVFTGTNGEGDTTSLTYDDVEELKKRFTNRRNFKLR